MKFLRFLSLFSTLALAAPPKDVSLDTRQASSITVTSVSATGPGCPSGSWTSQISPDGVTVLVGFSSYQVFVGGGVGGDQREKYCDVTIGLRFPLGCTTATLDTTYHGFAQLDPGVQGTVNNQYSLSPGLVTSVTPPSILAGSVWEGGSTWQRTDPVTTRTQVSSSNQQVAAFIARTRVYLQALNSDVFGMLSVDDMSVHIVDQQSC